MPIGSLFVGVLTVKPLSRETLLQIASQLQPAGHFVLSDHSSHRLPAELSHAVASRITVLLAIAFPRTAFAPRYCSAAPPEFVVMKLSPHIPRIYPSLDTYTSPSAPQPPHANAQPGGPSKKPWDDLVFPDVPPQKVPEAREEELNLPDVPTHKLPEVNKQQAKKPLPTEKELQDRLDKLKSNGPVPTDKELEDRMSALRGGPRPTPAALRRATAAQKQSVAPRRNAFGNSQRPLSAGGRSTQVTTVQGRQNIHALRGNIATAMTQLKSLERQGKKALARIDGCLTQPRRARTPKDVAKTRVAYAQALNEFRKISNEQRNLRALIRQQHRV
jgi:hypothetical protein